MLFGSRIGFIVASKSGHIVLGKWGTDHIKSTPQLLLRELRNKRDSEDVCRMIEALVTANILDAQESDCLHRPQALRIANNEEQYRSIARSVNGIVFFGTPHQGTKLADWASMVTRVAWAAFLKPKKEFLETLKRNSQDLMAISEDFTPLAEQYSIVSFWEEDILSEFGDVVVPKYSAVLNLPWEDKSPLGGDHRSICRFSGLEDPRFETVWKAIKSVIRDAHLQRVRKKPDELVSPRPPPLSKPSYKTMPSSSPHFTGRTDLLMTLAEFFGPREGGERHRRSYLLYGMGGLGKTQICLKFIENHQDLDLAAQAHGVGTSPEHIVQWFSRIGHEWLLVFDNANGDPSVVMDYLPPGPQGNMLFTSRNPNMRRLVAPNAYARVDGMEEDDAVSLLLKAAYINESSQELRTAASLIVKELYYLPLAVDQAGATIAEGVCSIHNYLVMYSRHRTTLLEYPLFKGASKYGRAVYGTWDLSLAVLKDRASQSHDPAEAKASRSAILITQIFAFLHHENIMEEILKRSVESSATGGFSYHRNQGQHLSLDMHDSVIELLSRNMEGWNQLPFREGIKRLLSLSLIRRDISDGVYSMHPLVHSWAQTRVFNTKQLVTLVNTILSTSITFEFSSQDFAFHRNLFPHIHSLRRHIINTNNTQIYSDEDKERYSFILKENGYWQEAEELDMQVVETRKKVLGEEHPNTLTSMLRLAQTYRSLGRLEEAEELAIKVLKIRMCVLGEEHPDTLDTEHNLALICGDQQQWKKAEEMEMVVISTVKRMPVGKPYWAIVHSIKNLAFIYQVQGKEKEAEKWQLHALEYLKEDFGEEHPQTLTHMQSLAEIYQLQGRWDEAEELGVQVVEMRKKVLGEEYPDTLFSIANLVVIYYMQGQWKKAEELGIQVVEMRKRVLGTENPATLTSTYYLARVCQMLGQWNKAEELLVQTVEMRKKVLGEENRETLDSMQSLALNYQAQGQCKKEEELLVQTVKLRKKVLGEEHPDTIWSMINLIRRYYHQGRRKEAFELAVQVKKAQQKVSGKEYLVGKLIMDEIEAEMAKTDK